MTQRQAVNAADEDGTEHRGERTWYVYDAAGQRVRKVTELPSGQIKSEHIYLASFEIYRRTGAHAIVRETLHIMDDKQRIALVETRTAGLEPGVPARLIRYQLGTHLGSVGIELGDRGEVVSFEEYFSFGGTAVLLLAGLVRRRGQRFRHTAKERDEESGLYYHGARYYASYLGRWLSPDPKESNNRYVYGSNNPLVGYLLDSGDPNI